MKSLVNHFLTLPFWRGLSSERKKVEKFVKILLPKLEEKAKPFTKPFSMPAFYEFCKEQNIAVWESEVMPKVKVPKGAKPRGFFCYDENGNPLIWLKTGKKQTDVLHTVAHELSHYLLSDFQSKTPQTELVLMRNEGVTQIDLMIEMEADLLASFLLTDKRGE